MQNLKLEAQIAFPTWLAQDMAARKWRWHVVESIDLVRRGRAAFSVTEIPANTVIVQS